MELASVPAARDRIEFLQIQTEWGFLLLPSRGRLQPDARCSPAGAFPRRTARTSERAGPEPVRASRRRPGGGCGGAGAPGPGTRHPAPDRAPRHPGSPRPRAGRLSSAAGRDPAGIPGCWQGPGRPSEEELLGGGSPVPGRPLLSARGARRRPRGAGDAGRAGQGPGRRREEPGQPEAAAAELRAREPSGVGGPRSSAMPAAAGDGLLGEPAAPGGGGGAEDAARPAAACEGSFLPAWVSGVPRERLRDFQHHKRVGNYLIGSRKLGEGSFAKVREGLHVLTGEKVSPPGRGAPALGTGGTAGTLPGALHRESGCVVPAGHLPSACLSLRLKEGTSPARAHAAAAGLPAFSEGRSGVGFPGGRLVYPPSHPQPFCSSKGAAWWTPARGMVEVLCSWVP